MEGVFREQIKNVFVLEGAFQWPVEKRPSAYKIPSMNTMGTRVWGD